MTYDEYINNPMGTKNAVISNREMYRTMYTQKLDTIMVREAGKITYHAYKSGSKYYCYMKIPSEKVPDVQYDVIVEFSKPKSSIALDNSLKNYDVRFYSNDPSFMFSFCHAFIKNKMFITEYSDKMSKKAIKERGLEKNPKDLVGYVKSLYFMYLIMKKKGLFSKLLYTENYNEKAIKQQIMHADKKLQERQEKANELSRAKKVRRASINRPEPEETSSGSVIRNTKMTKTTKTIGKSSNTVKSIKRTKTIK